MKISTWYVEQFFKDNNWAINAATSVIMCGTLNATQANFS